ncbi:efflux RND transporter periplasmic adaptor subunit [Pirellulaceae bacterium SH449]
MHSTILRTVHACVQLAALIAYFAGCLENTALSQSAVRTEQVQLESLRLRHSITGTLRSIARGRLAVLEPGRVVEVIVREGDEVRKGDIVARIDARRLEVQKKELESEVERGKADLQRERARLKQAGADLNRAAKLMEERAISDTEYDEYLAAKEIADATILATEKNLDRLTQSIALMQIRIDDMTLRAPFDASVIERLAEPGDWMQAGDAILTLVSTGNLEAWLDVPERFVREVAEYGREVILSSPAIRDAIEVVSVRRISDVNPRVRSLRVVAVIENPTGLLTAGMSIEGWLPLTEEASVMTVHKDALLRRPNQTIVYKVVSEGDSYKAQPIDVQIEFETGTRVAIRTAGVSVGDQVIVEGNERLSPGQIVAPILPTQTKTSF